jgi:hypothetical protein
MDGETEGIIQVGELPVIRRRERAIFEDHSQALRSGREQAFNETLAFVIERNAEAGPYDDTRPWSEMVTFLTDRIRDNGATT